MQSHVSLNSRCWQFFNRNIGIHYRLNEQRMNFLRNYEKTSIQVINNTWGFQCSMGFCYKGRPVIPRISKLLVNLIDEFHNSPIGRHSNKTKTYQRIAVELYWIGMRKDIIELVQNCTICQQNKHLAISLVGLLQPIPLFTQVRDEITIISLKNYLVLKGWIIYLQWQQIC